jgi:hypothetical protein
LLQAAMSEGKAPAAPSSSTLPKKEKKEKKQFVLSSESRSKEERSTIFRQQCPCVHQYTVQSKLLHSKDSVPNNNKVKMKKKKNESESEIQTQSE